MPSAAIRRSKCKAKTGSTNRSFVAHCHLIFFPETGVAEILGEGDKVVAGLVA
jgi:hypothetical protein